MDSHPTLSVLLPVHAGAEAAHLEKALESLINQTIPADEIVLVVDGPVPSAHEEVIAGRHAWVRVIRIESCQGISHALDTGLRAINTSWVARMDADDVSVPHRFEMQLHAISTSSAQVVGSSMLELDENLEHPVGVRHMPRDHRDIARQFRKSNPINHPTVVFSREAAVRAGGYQSLDGLEDYDLFARMLANGAHFHNLSEPLVHYRGGNPMLRRRPAWRMLRAEFRLQRRLLSYGVTTPLSSALWFPARMAFRAAPLPIKRALYKALILRRGGLN